MLKLQSSWQAEGTRRIGSDPAGLAHSLFGGCAYQVVQQHPGGKNSWRAGKGDDK